MVFINEKMVKYVTRGVKYVTCCFGQLFLVNFLFEELFSGVIFFGGGVRHKTLFVFTKKGFCNRRFFIQIKEQGLNLSGS